MTEDLQLQLHYDLTRRQGIYDWKYGDIVRVGKSEETGCLVLCGKITADNARQCRGIFKKFKTTAKDVFENCTETSDMMIEMGYQL